MKKRLFIAINFPENIKKELLNYQKRFQKIPAHWIKSENIHITLVFLGYIEDDRVEQIESLIKIIALKHKNFDIGLEKIIYGPPKTTPRMIWATIKSSDELKNLQKELENALFEGGDLFKKENKEFLPHITLCRFNHYEFRKMKNPPKIDEKISLKFSAHSVDLMESKLKRSGAEYFLIKKFLLPDKSTEKII